MSKYPPIPLSSPSARSEGFWEAVHSAYDLTPADAEIVVSVCRTLTTIDRLQVVIDGLDSLIVSGSHGEKPAAALTEMRAQLTLLDRLVSRLSFDAETAPLSALLP